MRSRTPTQIGLVIALLVTVTLAAVFVTRDAFADADRRERERLGQVVAATAAVAGADIDQVGSIRGLFDASREVRLPEFQVFARRILDTTPSLDALSFTARVDAEGRRAHERRSGRPISEQSPQGPRPAGARPVYYPIMFSARRDTPLGARAAAVGIDAGADPRRRQSLERAADSARPIATEPLRLLAPAGARGVVVFVPIYRTGVAPATVTARRAALTGFAVGVIELGRVARAVRRALPAGTRFAISDAGAGAPLVGDGESLTGARRDILLAGRTWRVAVSDEAHAPPLVAYVLAGAGLLLAGLLAALFGLSARRERYAEGLVARRLHEREAAEAALAQSEARMRSIIQTAADAIVIADADGRVVGANPAAARTFGWSEVDAIGGRLADVLPGCEAMVRAAAGGGSTGEAGTSGSTVLTRRRDGTEIPVELTLSAWSGGAGERFVTCIARDVSERRAADERLRASEASFRLLAEHSTDVVVRLSPTCTFLYASPAAREVLGREPEELLGRALFEFIHPDDLGEVRARQGSQPDGDRLPPLRVRLRHRCGDYVWIESTGRAILDSAGGLVEFRVALRDVSARVADQLAIEASAERHRAISAQAPVGIFEAGGDGRCTWVNGRWEDVTGLAAGAVWLDAVHAEDRARVGSRWAAFTAGQEEFSAECRLVGAEGAVTWVAAAAVAMHDGGGRLAGYLGTATDISARLEAEGRLHEAEERVRLAFERSPIGIALISIARASAGRFLEVNPAFCAVTGRTAAELLTMRTQDLQHPDDLPAHFELARRIIRGDVPEAAVEERYLRPDGRLVDAEVNLGLVRDVAGDPLYVIAMIQDVGERHALERAKDEFLALASHELRTPLTSVLGYLQLVLDGEAGELSADQRRLLEVAERRGAQLVALVADIHTVARADAGRLHLERTPLDVADLVAELVEGARPAALERGVELRLVPAPAPIVALADPTRLAQVVDNLISNALKFTPAGGRVVVSAERIAGRIAIRVRDTGPGIPAAERGQLFQRFFRTQAAIGDAVPGTGLGLAIARTIAEGHGGAIAHADAPGGGSVFTIELPAEVPAGPRAAAVVAGVA